MPYVSKFKEKLKMLSIFFKNYSSGTQQTNRPFYDVPGNILTIVGLLFMFALSFRYMQLEAIPLIAARALCIAGFAYILQSRIKPVFTQNKLLMGTDMLLIGIILENLTRMFSKPFADSTSLSVVLSLSALVLYIGKSKFLAKARYVQVIATALYAVSVSSAMPLKLSLVSIVFPFAAVALLSVIIAITSYTKITGLKFNMRSNIGLLVLASVSAPAYMYTLSALYAQNELTAQSNLYALLPYLGVVLYAPAVLLLTARKYITLPEMPVRYFAALLLVASVGVASVSATLPLQKATSESSYQYARSSIENLLATGSVNSMTSEEGAGPKKFYRGLSFEECDAVNARDCFITYYDTMAMRYGVKYAVLDIVSKVKNNKGVNFPAHCHQTVHNLGQMAYTVSETFAAAAEIDPQVCGTGYTHGLWEQQFVKIGDKAMFDQTGTLCSDLNMLSPWYKWTCHHILGHIMSQSLSTDPGLAAAYCTKVTDPQALTDCLTGAWMNFFQDDVVIEKMRKDGDMLNLFGVCYSAPSATKYFCYQELFPVIYAMVGGSDYEASNACLTYAEPSRGLGDPWVMSSNNYTDRCIQGLARGVSASSAIDYTAIGRRCLDMLPKAQDPCLTAGAASIVLNTGSTKAAFTICPLVKDQGYREYCYFWAKHARSLLKNGPNSFNLPEEDEIRTPEGVDVLVKEDEVRTPASVDPTAK